MSHRVFDCGFMVISALKYLNAGLSVIPVSRYSKKPAVSWRQYQHQQADKKEILRWFNYYKHYNIAIVTGEVSGNVAVIDFDSRAHYIQHKILFDGLPIVMTPGGYHVYIKLDKRSVRNGKIAIGNSGVIAEIKSEGGYVVAPPSYYSKGDYKVISGDITDIPLLGVDELKNLIQPIKEYDTRERGASSPLDINPENFGKGGTIFVSDIDNYVQRKLRAGIRKVESAPKSDRNNTLFQVSAWLGEFVLGEYINYDTLRNMLINACRTNGLIRDDGMRAVTKTINSGIRYANEPPVIKVHEILEGF